MSCACFLARRWKTPSTCEPGRKAASTAARLCADFVWHELACMRGQKKFKATSNMLLLKCVYRLVLTRHSPKQSQRRETSTNEWTSCCDRFAILRRLGCKHARPVTTPSPKLIPFPVCQLPAIQHPECKASLMESQEP